MSHKDNTQYPSYFLDNEREIFLLSASKEWQDSISRHYSCNNNKKWLSFSLTNSAVLSIEAWGTQQNIWQTKRLGCLHSSTVLFFTDIYTLKQLQVYLLTMVRMKINPSCSLHILFANSYCCSMLNAYKRPNGKSYEMIKPQLVDDWITLCTR